MLAASRLIRHPVAPTSTVFPSAYNLIRKTTSIKFHNKGPEESDHITQQEETSQKMEKTNAEKHRGESMKSFGEGYSTRSEDEGFGGVYGGNQDHQTINEQEKKHASVKSYDFDKNQGSQVKEKEKARHQKHDQSD